MNERERLLALIEREFDLELLLKYRELAQIEGEIGRGQELRDLVEKLILNGKKEGVIGMVSYLSLQTALFLPNPSSPSSCFD